MLADGRLRTTSPPWEGYDGARIVREQGFDTHGDFVTTHTITKVPQSHVIGAVWTITQTIPALSFYVPLNPSSPYKDNFFWFGFAQPKDGVGASVLSARLLELHPKTGQGFKLGAHPLQPALAAVQDGLAFVQRADPQEGQYHEGTDGAGLSVEVYHHDASGTGEYVEMEFLSPLRRLEQGASLTTLWSVHRLPEKWTPSDAETLLHPSLRTVDQ